MPPTVPLVVLLLAAVPTLAASEAGVAEHGRSSTGPAPTTGHDRARLTVIVTGITDSTGQLLVAAFTSAEGWPKAERAAVLARVDARAPEQEITLEGVPPGPCAVTVVHDLDANGKLTMRWFPIPRPAEPTGASNGATGSFGPPSFERARFELPPEGATVRIALSRR